MKEVAAKLIEFGQDFEYENFGSKGEKISVMMGLSVQFKDGLALCFYQDKKMQCSEDDSETIVDFVEKACIEETSSF